MIAGDPLTYPLGAVTSPNDKPVTSSCSAPKWVIFDAKTYTIYVLEKATDAKISGELGSDYTVSITLQDTAGGKGTYSFTITVKPAVV